jgi:PAS domain S-box-containing protein
MADPPRDIRVLHVDDEPAFLELTSTLLERADEALDVKTVEDAPGALETLESGQFDCVVSDYDMPGMDGLELLREVREADPNIPFVLFTGRGSEEVASEAISAGVTEYMQKGTDGDQFVVLANRVRNAVERYWVETSLGELESRYRQMLQTSPSPVVLFDDEATIDYANEAAAEMVGVSSSEELVGESVQEFVHPESSDLVRERLRTVIEDREAVPTVEQRYVRPDGEDAHALIATAPVTYDGKEGGQAVLSDVTDLREVERELLVARTFVDQVLDALDDAFYHLDMDGEVVQVNVRTEEMSGRRQEELLGGHVSELFETEDEEAVEEAVEEALEGGEVHFTAELVSHDGERVPLTLRNQRLVGPSGEPLGVVGFGRHEGKAE